MRTTAPDLVPGVRDVEVVKGAKLSPATEGDTETGAALATNPQLPLPACAAPDARTPPKFILEFRRPLQLKTLLPEQGSPPPPPFPSPLSIACVGVSDFQVDIALDPTFEQTWVLQQQSIGDLASTMGLAPGEKLTLEVQTTQRKLLDQESIDSTESMSSTESTTSDTEAVDITRASSKTQGWHVDSTGTLTCGYASLSVSAGFSQSVTDSNSQAIHHISASTTKSASSLKTLHKIQVRGVTETLITNRMTRIVVNPYPDRTMTVNIFQLLKHYTVETAQTELRIALIIGINDVAFDNHFVVSNADFLRQTLLDSTLIDNLDAALAGDKPQFGEDVLKNAAKYARRALHLLFDDVPMFQMPSTSGTPDRNFPSNSFNASVSPNLNDSGLVDSYSNDLGLAFCVLNYFYSYYADLAPDGGLAIDEDDDLAIAFATSLANDIGAKIGVLWPDPTKDPAPKDVRNILDNDQYTEIMRRIPGFLTLVSGFVQPLVDPAKLEKAQQQQLLEEQYALSQLLQHLECNKNYYIQSFLTYIARTTRNQAIVDLGREAVALAAGALNAVAAPLKSGDFDFDRVFIDKQQIVVPTVATLTDQGIADIIAETGYKGDPPSLPPPDSVALDVPADGMHLEVAEGACKLKGVPSTPTTVNLSVHDAQLAVSAPAK